MEAGESTNVVRVTARVAVRTPDDGPVDEATADAVHNATSALGVCATSYELGETGLRGGRVLLQHFGEDGFFGTAEYESETPVGAEVLEFLTERTTAEWSDGSTAAFFEYLGQRLGIPILVNWRRPMRVEQFRREERRFRPWSDLARACWQGDLAAARAALDAGGDPNDSADGLPVLHGAIEERHVAIARLLIDRGADVRAADCLSARRDPLWTCVTGRGAEDPAAEIAQMLLERGANPGGGGAGSPRDVARRRKWTRVVGLLEGFATAPCGGLRAGDRVRVGSGLFDGKVGVIDGEPGATGEVRVRVELLGRCVTVEVPREFLRPLDGPDAPV